MKRFLTFLVLLLIVAAYLGGRWPEAQKRAQCAEQLARAEAELIAAQSRVRVARLLGQVLGLRDVLGERNYGIAQEAASRFFDDVREESARTQEAAFKAALEGILKLRDPFTVALTRSDPAAAEIVRGFETRLRNVLGFEAPTASPEPAASPAPAERPVSPGPTPSATPPPLTFPSAPPSLVPATASPEPSSPPPATPPS